MTRCAIAPCLFVIVLTVAALGGCSQYVDGYRYAPQPALVPVASSNPQEHSPVTTLVSVVGVRRRDAKENLPASVEIRVRLENTGSQPVLFDPGSLRLATGDLESFPPPQTLPPGPQTIGAGQVAEVRAYFPFPPGRSYDTMNLASLLLTWNLQIGQQNVPERTQFTLLVPVYYYYGRPYYYDPWYDGGYVGAEFGPRYRRR